MASEFTQLILKENVITPPVSEKVYNKGWISTMTITSPCVNNVRIYTIIVPARDNPDTGEKELKPNLVDGEAKVICIDNVWEILPNNPKFGMAMELLFQSTLEYGQQAGIFFDPNATLTTDVSAISGDTLTTELSSISSTDTSVPEISSIIAD